MKRSVDCDAHVTSIEMYVYVNRRKTNQIENAIRFMEMYVVAFSNSPPHIFQLIR